MRRFHRYLNRGKGEKEYKLKAIVPSFVQVAAESYVCFAAFVGRRLCMMDMSMPGMVHFVFELGGSQATWRFRPTGRSGPNRTPLFSGV